MCELLIRVKGNTHVDPLKDLPGTYKRGDIVLIMPSGWHWGRDELGPGHPLAPMYQPGGEHYNGQLPLAPKDGVDGHGGNFVVVRVLRVNGTPIWSVPLGWEPGDLFPDPPAKLEAYIESERSQIIFEPRDPALGVVDKRRAWRVLVDDLPPGVITQLWNTGYYEVEWTKVRAYIQNKLSGDTEALVSEGALS